MATTTQPATAATLTAADRCDRCAAQAYVEYAVISPEGAFPLMFCAHHAHQHQHALAAAGHTLVADDRRLLTNHETGDHA